MVMKELTKVHMFETGTGACVDSMSHLFAISAACFSDTGSYLVLGSKTGHIGIWTVGGGFSDNIVEVLEQMRVNPKFWNDYPIMSPDDEKIDNEDSSDSEITVDNGRNDHIDMGGGQRRQTSNSSKHGPIRVGNKFMNVDTQSNNKRTDKPIEQQRYDLIIKIKT